MTLLFDTLKIDTLVFDVQCFGVELIFNCLTPLFDPTPVAGLKPTYVSLSKVSSLTVATITIPSHHHRRFRMWAPGFTRSFGPCGMRWLGQLLLPPLDL
jgi:hypothetical protein